MILSTRLVRNFGSLAFGKTVADAASFVALVLVSRAFGQEGVGQYSFAIGLTGLLAVATDGGLYMLTVKELSRTLNDRDRVIAGCRRVLRLRYALAGLSLVVLAAVTPLLPFGPTARAAILLVGAFQILNAVVDGYASVLVAREEMGVAAGIEVSMRVSITGLVGALVVMDAGLLWALGAFPLGAAVHAFVAHRLVARRLGPGFLRGGTLEARETLGRTRPFWVAELLRYLGTRLDVVCLGFLAGTLAVGIYNVAYRFLFLLSFLPYYATLAMFPSLSRMYESSPERLPALYGRAVGAAVLFGLPGAVGLFFVADELIALVFGPEFAPAAEPLRWLSWLFMLACLDNVLGTLLTSCDRQAQRTRAQSIAVGLNAVGNLALIPPYGVVGAAIATVFSTVVLVGLYLVTLRPVVGWPRCGGALVQATVGTGSFAFVLSRLPELPLAGTVGVAAVVYGAVIAASAALRRALRRT